AMRFDVRAMGNHDYAYGEDVVLRHTQDDHAVVLASNAVYTGDRPDDWHAVDRVVLEVGCVKVGLYSVNTPPWITKGHCDPALDGDCHYLGGLIEHSYDFVTEVQALVDDLAEQADLVVALNHIGQGADQELMNQTTGTHLALGSHSHSFTALPLPAGDTFLVQAGSNNDWVIRMDVTVDLETRQPIDWAYDPRANTPDNGLPVDDRAEAELQRLFTEYAPELWEPVGTTASVGTRDEAAALMARAARVVGEADAALVDQDWIRSGYPAGDVDVQDLFELVPHEKEPPGTPSITSFWKVTMTGAHLKLAIADGAYTYDGPEADAIEDATVYEVVTMKRAAELPVMFMPGRPTVETLSLSFVGENWSVMHRYAQARQAACQYLDEDAAIPGCTP
ncbi:MAG: hypothetical protein KC656_28630, partial [Myxococcales bacterium]|nr:hypothetical protein [Myxococcales bacterium]